MTDKRVGALFHYDRGAAWVSLVKQEDGFGLQDPVAAAIAVPAQRHSRPLDRALAHTEQR